MKTVFLLLADVTVNAKTYIIEKAKVTDKCPKCLHFLKQSLLLIKNLHKRVTNDNYYYKKIHITEKLYFYNNSVKVFTSPALRTTCKLNE